MNLNDISSKVWALQAKKKLLEKNLMVMEKLLDQKKSYLDKLIQVQTLFQTTAKELQESVQFHIEELVQSVLDSCFPGQYEFNLNFEIKRGQTETDIFLTKKGDRIDPMEETGGGIVDILTFALRLATWSLSDTDNVLILDEPFRFLSAGLRPLIISLLGELVKKLNLQIIMVTHSEELIGSADKVFHIVQDKGRSECIE